MTATQAAANIRASIKLAGIKASVRVAPGGCSVQVNAPAYGVWFDEQAQRTIRLIAKSNGFTWVRGMEIDVEQMTNPAEFCFYQAQ